MIKIKMVSVPISDQDRALEFYTQKLDLSIITDAPFGNGQRWIELAIPYSEIRLCLFTPPGQEDRIGTFSNIVFTCENIENTYKKLKAKGVEFIEPPKRESWGTSALFKDPDGNVFCLSSE